MGPYGTALDFRQISQHQITSLGRKRPRSQRNSCVRNAAVSMQFEVQLRHSHSQWHAHLLRVYSQTVEAPQQTRSLGEITRPQFPILHQEVNGKPLIYLDNSATSQKPDQVRQAMDNYYGAAGYNSNVHRGVHHLSSKATAAYEHARDKVANFINARSSREIVFVKNATEGLNLIANTWGTKNIKEGDEVSFPKKEQLCVTASSASVCSQFVDINAHSQGKQEACPCSKAFCLSCCMQDML